MFQNPDAKSGTFSKSRDYHVDFSKSRNPGPSRHTKWQYFLSASNFWISEFWNFGFLHFWIGAFLFFWVCEFLNCRISVFCQVHSFGFLICAFPKFRMSKSLDLLIFRFLFFSICENENFRLSALWTFYISEFLNLGISEFVDFCRSPFLSFWVSGFWYSRIVHF